MSIRKKIPVFKNKGLALSQNKNLKVKFTLFKESFHRLQTIIMTQSSNKTTQKPVQTIMVTSALPWEGKSTIVTNLAIAFSKASAARALRAFSSSEGPCGAWAPGGAPAGGAAGAGGFSRWWASFSARPRFSIVDFRNCREARRSLPPASPDSVRLMAR